jgi:hypothetical protein
MLECRRLMNVEFCYEKTVSALHKRKTEVGSGKRRDGWNEMQRLLILQSGCTFTQTIYCWQPSSSRCDYHSVGHSGQQYSLGPFRNTHIGVSTQLSGGYVYRTRPLLISSNFCPKVLVAGGHSLYGPGGH